MRKASTLRGMDIIATATGEKVGEVTDVVFSPLDGQLIGFGVHNGKWINGKKFLAFSNVTRIGQDAIMIVDKSLMQKKEEMKDFLDNYSFLETKVMTEGGKELGMIEDYIVDEEIGIIEGYELSGGIIPDIIEGRGVIDKNDLLVQGKEMILVPDYLEEKLNRSRKEKTLEEKTKGGEMSDDAKQ